MLMDTALTNIKETIKTFQGKRVDIIYHPHSAYRMVKQGDARIGKLFEHFFEVEVDTGDYGTYRTTITYLDIYTKSCKICEHKENQSED